MKTNKICLWVSLWGFFFSAAAYSQDYLSAISYNISFPSGDTQEYINKTSWRGVSLEGRRFIRPNVTIGLFFGWHVFDEQVSNLISFDRENLSGNITGKQFRYLNSFPIQLNSHYYFGREGYSRLYIGGGAGATHTIQRFELGLLALEERNWHFSVAPEVGFIQPLGTVSDLNLLVNAKYHYALESGESITGEKFPHSYWGLSIGIAYTPL